MASSSGGRNISGAVPRSPFAAAPPAVSHAAQVGWTQKLGHWSAGPVVAPKPGRQQRLYRGSGQSCRNCRDRRERLSQADYCAEPMLRMIHAAVGRARCPICSTMRAKTPGSGMSADLWFACNRGEVRRLAASRNEKKRPGRPGRLVQREGALRPRSKYQALRLRMADAAPSRASPARASEPGSGIWLTWIWPL